MAAESKRSGEKQDAPYIDNQWVQGQLLLDFKKITLFLFF